MRALLLSLGLLLATPVLGVQPDEVMPDPALETRARAISALIRCPVCQGENIDDSSAPIARDLRLLVRERLTAGDSDQAVIDYIVDRYGEFVLFRPTHSGANMILWWGGPIMLLLGVGGAAAYVSRRRAADPARPLDSAEEARLADILKD